jgi:hypothetical protein
MGPGINPMLSRTGMTWILNATASPHFASTIPATPSRKKAEIEDRLRESLMMKNYNVKAAGISSPLAPGLRSMKTSEGVKDRK